MNLKSIVSKSLISLFILSFYTACGSSSGAGGADALNILASGNNAPPSLDAIASSASAYSGLVQGYNVGSPYWVFTSGGIFGQNYLAPAPGIVSDQGTATINGSSVTYITIIHSGNLASRVFGIQTLLARPGDYVSRSQIIGTYVGSGLVAFQVLLNGSPVCPLSFMSNAFRQNLQLSSVYTSSLCQ